MGCLLGEHPRFDPLALRVALAGGLAPLLAGRYGARTPRAVGRSPLGPPRRGSRARVGTGDGVVPQSLRGTRFLAREGLGRHGRAVISPGLSLPTPEHLAGGVLRWGTSPGSSEALRASRFRPSPIAQSASQGRNSGGPTCCETGLLSCGSVVQRFSRRGPVE